ncbi:MAG: aspartate--tRNA(Asn) ligase [Candidatus Caldarchaeum sp.]|nr:aspartate--tRNA(Asn) ligase [Candidatus Caldarchaeum sp.]MDW8359848.1 aspartate--tRNA(Asn) ligase [Candidatus Caldarchaeum sp.]
MFDEKLKREFAKRVLAGEINDSLDGKHVNVFGWVHEVRDLGKLVFIVLRDVSGVCQVVFRRDELDESALKALNSLSNESVVFVHGVVAKQPKSRLGVEIVGETLKVLSQAAPRLEYDPTEKVSASLDVRLKHRILDLRRQKVKPIFILGSAVLKALRDFLYGRGFIEVRTPKIIGSATEGGAELFEVKYFDRVAYLAQSPQLYKEQLTTVFEKVFEIGPFFRAEQSHTRRHISEFTSVDIEQAFADMDDVMKTLEEAIAYVYQHLVNNHQKELSMLGLTLKVPKTPFKRITYDEAVGILEKDGISLKWGEDFGTPHLRALAKHFHGFYFITGFPTEIKPFYIQPSAENPSISESFDLMYQWLELASGGTRVNEHSVLRERLIQKGLDPKQFEDHLKVFEYGMPVHAGWGLGFERLMMVLTRHTNIREVILFPRDRFRLTP